MRILYVALPLLAACLAQRGDLWCAATTVGASSSSTKSNFVWEFRDTQSVAEDPNIAPDIESRDFFYAIRSDLAQFSNALYDCALWQGCTQSSVQYKLRCLLTRVEGWASCPGPGKN